MATFKKSIENIKSACERGDLSELQRVLEESQLDIGSMRLDKKGQTALHIACANGHLHIAQYLVNERECSVMVEDIYGHTPFILSMINKHWKVAEFLLTHAVAPSSDSFKKHIGLLHYGESLVAKVADEAFIESCSSGYFKLVKFLKEKYDIQISERYVQSALDNGHVDIALYLKFGEEDASPSHIASLLNKAWASKQWDSASVVLKCAQKSGSHESIGLSSTGLDQLIEVASFELHTFSIACFHAFNTACNNGYLEVVTHLHEKGICYSSPALESARSKGHLHIVHFLLKYCKCTKPYDMSEIHVACIVGDEEKVTSSLATNGAKVISKTDWYGMNALHYASHEPKILTMIIAMITKENSSLFNTKDRILGNSPLHYAVLAGCTESVSLLLRAPECDINLVTTKGETPLHLACRQSDKMVLHMLATEKMCDLNVQNDNGDTALHIAACSEWNSAEKIQCILDSGRCDPNITNKQGYTPLHTLAATVHNQLDSLIKLLNSTKCNPNIQNFQGNTALHLSIHLSIHQKSATGIEPFLMCDKLNVNIQNEEGNTPLHVAVITDATLYITEKLIGHPNCNPCITNHEGMTPLQLTFKTDQVSATEVLLLSATEVLFLSARFSHEDKAKAMPGLLHCAIRADRMPLFIMLIEMKECNVNEDGRSGQTPLHVACIVESMEYFQALLQYPTCDLNIQDDNGDTTLHIAARIKWNSAEKIQCLLECDRCDPNITNKQGYTPLHIATVNSKFNSINIFMNCTKCNPNIQDPQGNTALHLSIYQKSATGIEPFLMCDKVDINIQNDKGSTPLYVAVITNTEFDIIKKLIGHQNCNPSIANHEGMTPLQLASNTHQLSIAEAIIHSAKYNHEDIAKPVQGLLHCAIHTDRMSLFMTLINVKEFNVNEVGHGGRTILHVACSKTNNEYVQALTQQPTCDLNIQDDNGDTALHIAARSEWNSAEKIQCMLECDRCDPNITNKQGYTPLHLATVYSQFDSVKIFLNSTKYNPNIQDPHGNTVLHWSIHQKLATGIEHFLMSDKVDVNIQNRQGDTPLHVAVKQEIPISVIEALAHHVHCNVSIANVSIDNEGMTPLQLSVKMKKLLVANVIVKKCSHEDIRKIAIEDTSDVLYNAVSENCVSLVQALAKLQRGKVNLRYGSYGETLLHAACRNGYAEITELLLENGAEVLAVDIIGEAPIHNASMYPIVLKILLDNGANVQAVDRVGDAPIHIACNGSRLDCLKAILQSKGCVPNQQNANGDTALHIVCRMGHNDNEYFVHTLLSMPGIDPKITNHAGVTPVEVAGTNYLVIQTINNFLKQKQSSLQTYLKIFVVGNSGTGKSTLIKAVTTEASQLLKYAVFPKMKFVNPSDVPPHTAGIVPIPFNSKHFGHAVLYDFAGQHEYYSSHAAVMENLILPTPPLFLLLIDISKPIEEIKEELVYWWQFINNLSQRAAAPPHVMFVASHKDKVRAGGEDPQSIIDKILKDTVTNISVSFKFEGSFPMDCRKLVSRGLTALLTQLNTTCQVLRQTADVDLHCHILKAFLTTTDFKALVNCELSLILEKIQAEDALLLPSEPSRLIPLLSTLSDQGHILLLQNYTDVNKSWVILKPEVVLAEVNGSIFAPDNFKEHFRNFAMSTGVVTLSKIREKFTEFHHEVLVEFLIHLEFCFRLKDKHTLELITKNEVSLTNQASQYREKYYFFPSLVRNENPEDVCLPQETDMYQCGWFYKCGKETEQLTTRFLHVLVLRLAFSCEPPDDPTERESVVLLRSCSVWKHGIAWWTDDGIETIVEVGLQCRWVAVMMRCPDTHRVQCAELRSKVIAIVLKAKQNFCPAITMNEFLIAPSSLRYPFERRELTLYSMKKIASIVVEGKDFAKDVEGKKKPLDVHLLLPFEPYYKLGDIIGSFFSAEQSLNKEISQECLKQIAIKCHKNLKDFETALQPDLIAYEEECSRVGGSEVMKCVALFRTLKNSQKRAMKTWRDFEREFSRFSIFCGRNPMVTTTTLCS